MRATIVAVLVTCAAPSAFSAESLTIGSKAPAIEIEHWLNDKAPVTQFDPGRAYVIEFWATWCGPCVASIPHLRELQERHGDALTVISVSDEAPETIESFLDREHGGTTFREITSHYRLATDPDGSVKQAYMRAAGQSGIPTAFVVGKTGVIEWIGHPMRIDEPVARILADGWDRESYAKHMEEEREVREQLRLVYEKMAQHQHADALALIDKCVASCSSSEARRALEMARRRVQAAAEGNTNPVGGGGDPGRITHVDIRRLEIGDQVTLRVTGRSGGPIWGDSMYTLDSDLGTAAVHAGLLRIGEPGRIKVWVVPPPPSFGEASRHGILSRKWGPFRAAMVLQAVSKPTASARLPCCPPVNRNAVGDLPVGRSKTVMVTGSDKGPVWGTDTYTGDSRLEVAAVHAGLLQVGQRGEVVVTRTNPPDRFEGSVRNGVRSGSWGRYFSAYTIEPSPSTKP
jgi:thiol-disulfide isomerase/thioredoxin